MKRLAYISLLLVAAGCSPELTGPPPPQTGTLFSYFWADSTASYHYISSTQGPQTISTVFGSNTITDQQDTFITNLTVERAASGYALSGFGTHDLLELPPWMQIVSDTIPPLPRMEYVRSIAALNTHFGSGLFVATDSLIYQVDPANNVLTNPNSLPIPGLVLAEDVGGGGVYAYQRGGRAIAFTNSGGAKWAIDSTPNGTAITAFTSTYYKGGDLFWVACGSQLFEFNAFTAGTYPYGKPVTCPLGTITALEASPDDGDIIAADDAGNVYNVSQSKMLGQVHAGVRAMAQNYITTDHGIFDFTHSGPAIVTAADSAIYYTGLSLFASERDGSVDHFDNSGTNVVISAPMPGTMVTQFAYPVQSPRDPNKGVFALAGGQVYYLADPSSWLPLNQVVTPMGKFSPGALVVLMADTGTWLAGYLETTSFNGKQKGYAYWAKAYSPFAEDEFGGVGYSNILLVSFSTEAGGVADTANVPQYNFYYQLGKGLLRIERTFNGKTTTTMRQP